VRCLVVDDDERWQDTLQEELSLLGFNCSTAQNDTEAIREIKNAESSGIPFKLITIDRQMQEVGSSAGLRVLSFVSNYLQNRQGQTICIVISGTSTDTDVRNYFKRYGVSDFISKTDSDIWEKLKQLALVLAQSENTETVQAEARGAEESQEVRVLFLASNPSDTARLRLDEEVRSIDEALHQARFRGAFDLSQHWAVRISDLQSCLLRHQPHIVHFSGHGSKSNGIILRDNAEKSRMVSGKALGRLFSVLRSNVRCVVLNACYSEQQARSIAEQVDCVVGMSKAISDQAAISFSVAFYQALGYGEDVETAFRLGCAQIELQDLGEQDTPKLLAIKSDPGAVVFVRHDAA
jgi:CheY-like chemotaxis protein